MDEPSLRIDKFLWFTRITKTRGAAQAMAEAGHIRIDGRRIDRAHCLIRTNAVLTFIQHDAVRVVRVIILPKRRGSPVEAEACLFDMFDAGSRGVDGAPSQS